MGGGAEAALPACAACGAVDQRGSIDTACRCTHAPIQTVSATLGRELTVTAVTIRGTGTERLQTGGTHLTHATYKNLWVRVQSGTKQGEQ